MAEATALDLWREFLEKTPPNVPVTIANLFKSPVSTTRGVVYGKVDVPLLRLHCEIDDGVRWFEPSRSELQINAALDYVLLHHTCRNCGASRKVFAVAFQRKSSSTPDVRLMKLGEFPPFAVATSNRIKGLLGDEFPLYQQGCRAESQGLGIGAASYFRRIVESQWQKLIAEIKQAAQTSGETDLAIYDQAAREISFSKAVELLKDRLPQRLRILNGQNPLTLLHKPLSIQLHGLSDEECLQQAADIRVVLTALLENIATVIADQDELRAAVNRLRQAP